MNAQLKRLLVLSLPILGTGAILATIGCVLSADGGAPPPPAKATGLTTAKVGANPGGIVQAGPTKLQASANHELASFAAGCFWGTEDIFRQVPGVVATAVGYSGGHTLNPTYEDVCGHHTGHAESVLVEFDPAVVTYKELLAVFWKNHDPTTPSRQGPDVGSNYRSAIWCFSPEQLKIAQASEADEQKKLKHQITTEIKSAGPFYIAEDYHQQYDEKHGTHFCPIYHGS